MNNDDTEPQDEAVFFRNMWLKMRRWYFVFIAFYIACIAAMSLSVIIVPFDYFGYVLLFTTLVVYILHLTTTIIEMVEIRGVILGSLLLARSGTHVFLARKPDENTKEWIVFKQALHRNLRDRVRTLVRARGRGATVDDAIRDYMSKV